MQPEERDKIMGRLLATWPTPKIPDTTLMVWNEQLAPLRFDRSEAAVNRLVRTSHTRPSIAAFHEAYEAERHGFPEMSLVRPECGVCEDGFVDLTPDLTGTHHTLRRCPNGCKPLTAEQREERRRREDAEWQRERDAERRREQAPPMYDETPF